MSDVNPSQSDFILSRTVDVSRRATGATVQMVYVGPQDSTIKAAFLAAHPFGEAHGTYTTSELDETNERLLGGSGDTRGMVEITLTYKPGGTSASGVLGLMRPGDSTLESDSNAVEQPIEKAPPEWIRSGGTQATWTTALPALKLAGLAGIEGWIDPQPTVTRTDAVESTSFSFTQDEVTETVGKVLTGASLGSWGVSSADDGKWLFTNKRIVKNGETVTVSRVAQFNREGWETSYVYIDEANSTPENP